MGGSWRVAAGKEVRPKKDKLSSVPKSHSVQSRIWTCARQKQGCMQPSLPHSQASFYSKSHLELDEAEEEG